jgi:hypothetical protein
MIDGVVMIALAQEQWVRHQKQSLHGGWESALFGTPRTPYYGIPIRKLGNLPIEKIIRVQTTLRKFQQHRSITITALIRSKIHLTRDCSDGIKWRVKADSLVSSRSKGQFRAGDDVQLETIQRCRKLNNAFQQKIRDLAPSVHLFYSNHQLLIYTMAVTDTSVPSIVASVLTLLVKM